MGIKHSYPDPLHYNIRDDSGSIQLCGVTSGGYGSYEVGVNDSYLGTFGTTSPGYISIPDDTPTGTYTVEFTSYWNLGAAYTFDGGLASATPTAITSTHTVTYTIDTIWTSDYIYLDLEYDWTGYTRNVDQDKTSGKTFTITRFIDATGGPSTPSVLEYKHIAPITAT